MDAQDFSLANVPPHLLEAAYLTGKIPFRACQKDPRVSYTLYIPPTRYCEIQREIQSLARGQTLTAQQRLRLIVNVPGTRRNAAHYTDFLIPIADRHGVAVLSPLFPAALDGPFDLESFKLLRSKSLKADVVFLNILDEVAQIWPGIETNQIILAGSSGGAQFAHRFMYLYPERLAAVAISAPGSITRLDSDEAWPVGTGDVTQIFDGRAIEIDRIRRIKRILLLIGEDDTETAERRQLTEWVNEHIPGGKGVNTQEPVRRLEAIKALKTSWNAHGIECELIVIPGLGHDYTGKLPILVKWLEELIVGDGAV